MDMAKENSFISQTTGEEKLVEPKRQEVWDYCKELNSNVDPDKFFNFYEEREWTLRGEKINDWKALFRSWDRNEFRKTPKKPVVIHRYNDNPVRDEDLLAFMAEAHIAQ